MNSTFQTGLPVYIWFLIVGAVISFLLGCFQVEKLEVGLNGRLYRRVRYGDQFAMMNAAAFSAMTVLMWLMRLKSLAKIPRLMLFKIGLFGIAVLAMVGLFVLFWGIAFTAATMVENVKTNHTR